MYKITFQPIKVHSFYIDEEYTLVNIYEREDQSALWGLFKWYTWEILEGYKYSKAALEREPIILQTPKEARKYLEDMGLKNGDRYLF